MSVRHSLATSDHRLAHALRGIFRAMRTFSLPLPHWLLKVVLAIFLLGRTIYYWCFRVVVAEPLFKAYCHSYGRNVRTDVFVHWVQGRGHLIIGDDVLVDGKCSFNFAARFTKHPTLVVGSGSGIGHGCVFTVGKNITIGRNCRIAAGVWMFDSPGHPSDPAARLKDQPPSEGDVRPISIGDNVWIGGRAVIFPGVTIGDGSIVSAGAVVTADVPPNAVVAGNPARRIGSLAVSSTETK